MPQNAEKKPQKKKGDRRKVAMQRAAASAASDNKLGSHSFFRKEATTQKPSGTLTSNASKGEDLKAEMSQCPDGRPASCPSMKPTVDLFAKEEHYRLLNAELEAKTAELVRQTEQVMREQNEVLSKPMSSHLVFGSDEDVDLRNIKTLEPLVEPGIKVVTNKRATSTSKNRPPGNQRKVHDSFKTLTPKVSLVDDMAVVEDFGNDSLAKTICSMERKLDDGNSQENDVDDMSSAADEIGSDAQIRYLKAKLYIMQEEFNHLSYECNKKDDENNRLGIKIKEVEEHRARLQKTTNIQQTQIEKHRALVEESNRKCDSLQQLVSALHKEIEALKRAQKQAAGNHSSVEVRLNRALEEVERLKTQLDKMKQMSKDRTTQEHQKKETLLAENKMLEKQKAELIVGFKKHLKLIDILKRQKMHFEAAKMLSFTEEEFMKALDWGKS